MEKETKGNHLIRVNYMEPNSKQEPYSYHTFLLAFYCPNGTLNPGGNWEESKLSNQGITSTEEDFALDYATMQYFTPEARNLLFNKEKSFSYSFDANDENSRYIIKRDNKEYSLNVTKVYATMYGENVGVLAIALENRGHYDSELKEHLAVNEINEYGRRINLPFLSSFPHSLVADSISLFGVTEDFKKTTEMLRSGEISATKGYVMKPIRRLVAELMTANAGEKLVISPVIDDRMFVCCLVRNQPIIEALTAKGVDDYDHIYTDEKLSKSLYALGFIDADGVTCHNRTQREEILRRCVYARWRDYSFDGTAGGTIDVITHHSFVRITNGSAPDFIIKPFLTQYVYLAIGALMQRAAILWLSNESTVLSEAHLRSYNAGKITKEFAEDLRVLRKKYVYAQNNIFLHHLTTQEQGVEEFDMLKNELNIDESLDKLNQKVDGIYHFTEEYVERQENKLLNAIAYIGLPLALINLFVDVLGLVIFSENGCWGSFAVAGSFISFVLFGIIFVVAFIALIKIKVSRK